MSVELEIRAKLYPTTRRTVQAAPIRPPVHEACWDLLADTHRCTQCHGQGAVRDRDGNPDPCDWCEGTGRDDLPSSEECCKKCGERARRTVTWRVELNINGLCPMCAWMEGVDDERT